MKNAIEENSIPFPLIEDVFAVRTSLKAIANVFGCSIEKMKLATIKLYKVLKKL